MAVTYTEGSGDGKRDDVLVVVVPEPVAPEPVVDDVETVEVGVTVKAPKKAPQKITAGKHKR